MYKQKTDFAIIKEYKNNEEHFHYVSWFPKIS